MKLSILGTMLFAAALSATPALAQSKAPGVTDTEVTIGITTPLSGPAAAWSATALGAEAWAKHVNEQGGVNGRKIKIVMKDDGYNPGRALANVNEMKDSVFALVGLPYTLKFLWAPVLDRFVPPLFGRRRGWLLRDHV